MVALVHFTTDKKKRIRVYSIVLQVLIVLLAMLQTKQEIKSSQVLNYKYMQNLSINNICLILLVLVFDLLKGPSLIFQVTFQFKRDKSDLQRYPWNLDLKCGEYCHFPTRKVFISDKLSVASHKKNHNNYKSYLIVWFWQFPPLFLMKNKNP